MAKKHSHTLNSVTTDNKQPKLFSASSPYFWDWLKIEVENRSQLDSKQQNKKSNTFSKSKKDEFSHHSNKC